MGHGIGFVPSYKEPRVGGSFSARDLVCLAQNKKECPHRYFDFAVDFLLSDVRGAEQKQLRAGRAGQSQAR